MEYLQSSPANEPSKEVLEVISKKQVIGERGRIEDIIELSELNMTDTESESDYSSSDESDVEDNEEDLECLLILEDAKKLKVLATAFLHPEVPVSVDYTATARCYFDRNSAAEQEDVEASLYRSSVLDDVTALKALASDYAHPEKKVSTEDPSVYGRCYFNQPSASEQEDVNDMEDRNAVLEDVKNFRVAASFYLHPESTVGMDDSTANARCFFSRPSAVEQEEFDFAEEKAKILLDAAALKSLAIDYAHPEIGVTNADASAYGRNYFSRVTAVEHDDDGEAEERAQIHADAISLKKLAFDYAHPERGVSANDSTVFARNYFSRTSAVKQENEGETEERAQILADATSLKRLAVDYAHPERGVSATDSTVFARNYFSMASAVEQENEGEAEERAQILADATSFKRLAVDYAHPEVHVSTTEPAAFGRNYFSRASAVAQENEGESGEKAQILADATSLKRLAVDYAHPEHGVSTADATAFGRNYFTMLSIGKPLETPGGDPIVSKDLVKTKIVQKQQQFMSKLSSGKDAVHNKLSETPVGHVKRSPSTVILFGLGDDDGSAY